MTAILNTLTCECGYSLDFSDIWRQHVCVTRELSAAEAARYEAVLAAEEEVYGIGR